MQNDSTLLFNALSGINIEFNSQDKICKLSAGININDLMIRFKRNNLTFPSQIKGKIRFIYMKGYNANEINQLCSFCEQKPIFVSSMTENDIQLSIIPNDISDFHLFYLSKSFYQFGTVNDTNFCQILNNDKINELKISLNIQGANIIPINSNNYKFHLAGPVAHALIRSGCIFILKGKFPIRIDNQ